MKAIFIAPQCPPVEIDLAHDDYHVTQAIVAGGGLFSASPLTEELSVFYDDEGLFNGLPPNLEVNGMLLVGNLLVMRANEEGETVSTTDADFELVQQWMRQVKRRGHFEYQIPEPRIFAGNDMEELRRQAAADAMPPVGIMAVDGRKIEGQL